jgi:predicted O-methyltransferase YrrM
MEHFYEKIEGWFDFESLYNQIVSEANNNSHFVEIGTWLGRSASYMAVEIINSKKEIKFDCIDTWNGSEEHKNIDFVKNNTLYDEFIKNIEPVKGIINPIRSLSTEASKFYEDNSLDFVFIDASHDYENVKQDINAWYPKVKQNKILSGHDYIWSGVKQAVDEFISNNPHELKIMCNDNTWVIVKK